VKRDFQMPVAVSTVGPKIKTPCSSELRFPEAKTGSRNPFALAAGGCRKNYW